MVLVLGKEIHKLYTENCSTRYPGVQEQPWVFMSRVTLLSLASDEYYKTPLHYAAERNLFQGAIQKLYGLEFQIFLPPPSLIVQKWGRLCIFSFSPL